MRSHIHTSTRRLGFAAIVATAALAALVASGSASAQVQAGPPAADQPAPLTLRGYLLDQRKGRFTMIEPPGAISTKLGEINNRGEIVGAYSDGKAIHNFLRDRRGRYTTIDPPGAGGLEIGTNDVNDRGEIAGWYVDAAGTYRSFLRDRKGRFTAIEHPEAGGTSAYGSGTVVYAMNDRGEMVGTYAAGGTVHGFVRDRRGAFTTVDYPGAPETLLTEINERGQILGTYSDVTGGINASPQHFVLDRGDYTPVEPLGASLTRVDDINNRGEIVGLYIDAGGTYHGFLRDRRGRYSPIDHPDATPLGSASGGINDRGWIVGEYYDYLNTDANSSGLRRGSLDAEGAPGPLDGLQLAR